MASSPCPAGESFAYDKIGDLTSKAGVALNYGTTAPKHAVKSHGSTTYTYDANGSMTARGTQTIKYDPEQRPILVKDGASVHRASYDGDGVRRKREDGNGTVHYLGGYERKLAAGADPEAVTKYYSASLGAISRPIAFRRGGTLHWVGSDHLGGTIRVLNSSFTALDGMRYKPYGEDRDIGTALVTDRKFTGQTEDETAGLYWYASRAYDPAIGRFVSPDSIVPAPGNPQSLNRYSYVYNNPLKFVDPSGRSAEWFDKAWYDEFKRVHGKDPDESDINYRYHSMKATSQGDEWSVEHWSKRIWPRLPRPVRQVRDGYKMTLKGITALDATGAANQIYGDGDDRSEKNAFKHAYWSALLTKVVGPELAKEITDEHEELGMVIGQEPIDLAMDSINNEIGRGIGSKGMPVATLVPLLLIHSPSAEKETPIAIRLGEIVAEIRQDLIDRTVLAIDQGKLLEIREGRLVSTDGKP